MTKVLKYAQMALYSTKSRCLLLLLITIQTLNGCMMVGPDYESKELVTQETWPTELQGGLTLGLVDPSTLANWWTLLKDPQLTSLEERAVKGNLDLKNARSRILEARALRGVSNARLFPTLNVGATASKYHSSESSGSGTDQKLYTTGFDAGWELDIFGGTRRSLEAAQANIEASQESLHDVWVSLLAEVALNYVEVRTYQARLEVAGANINALQETYHINHSRYQAGIISELAVQESLRILESTRAIVPTLEVGLYAAKNRLAVLLGQPPGSLHKELADKGTIPKLPEAVAVGIPAETIRHRPDVRHAERNLAIQTARIGVATADLFPKFRLFGTLGLESISAGNLFQTSSSSWSIGPNVTWKIFSANAIRQNIKAQNERQQQALNEYEATVLRALEDVQNALVAYAKEQIKQKAIARASTASERAEQLARDQYEAGLVGFNNVLDAQRSLLLLRDELAQSNGRVVANFIRLYKTFGGGWRSE